MIFEYEGKEYEITREHIIRAMKAFDRGDCPPIYKSFLTNPKFTKAVKYGNGHLYPPKFLVRHATGLPGPKFNTDWAEYILPKLGFPVVVKP